MFLATHVFGKPLLEPTNLSLDSTHKHLKANYVPCYHAPPPAARQWGFCVLGQFIVSLVGRSTSCGVGSGEVDGLANVRSVVPIRREPMLQVLATVYKGTMFLL